MSGMMLIEVIVPMKLVIKPDIFIIKLFIFWKFKAFYFTERVFCWAYWIISNVLIIRLEIPGFNLNFTEIF